MDEIVVITGASSGIGRACGEYFENRSYKVINLSNHTSSFFEDILVDLSNHKSVEESIQRLSEIVGNERIFYLINNAGIMPLDPDSVPLYDKVMNTNLRSMYQLSLALIDYIDGGIINISSVSSFGPVTPEDSIAYGLSKAGVNTLTKYMAIKYPRLCINAVAPGFISPTRLCGDFPTPKELIDSVPKKREGNVKEISEFIYYLTQQKYITGTIIPFDGGLSL